MLKIYGTVYHSLNYDILNSESLFDLIFKNNENLSDISKLDYIDGIYSILYENEDNKIIITGAHGLYPLFYNVNTLEVINNFNKDSNFQPNHDYINLAEKNFDKSYHSLLSNNLQIDIKNIISRKIFISPFKYWNVTPPASIIFLNKKNKNIKIIYYNVYSELEPQQPEYLIENCLLKLSKDKKVLIPLSAGYDSRAIFSVLVNNADVSRYTYGSESYFIDNIIGNDLNFSNCISDHLNDYNNYDYYVRKYCLTMNGMGDLYYKVHNLYIQKYFKEYDILFTGDGSNEFIENHKKVPYYIYTSQYATGDGHHYKTQCNVITSLSPYCQKRLLYSVKNKNSRKLRIDICKNLIEKHYKKLLEYPFYSGNEYTKNDNSNFGHKFDFNTKKKYLNIFYEEFFS